MFTPDDTPSNLAALAVLIYVILKVYDLVIEQRTKSLVRKNWAIYRPIIEKYYFDSQRLYIYLKEQNFSRQQTSILLEILASHKIIKINHLREDLQIQIVNGSLPIELKI